MYIIYVRFEIKLIKCIKILFHQLYNLIFKNKLKYCCMNWNLNKIWNM